MKRWLLLALLVLAPLTAQAQVALERVDGPIRIEASAFERAPVVIEHKILYPTAPGQTAIVVEGSPEPDSVVLTSVIIRDVTIAPGNGFYWLHGVRLTNAWLAIVEHVNVIGPAGLPEPLTQNALTIDGKSTDVSVLGFKASGVIAGIFITGEAEGTRISGATIIGVRHCIVAWPSSGGGEPGLWITDSHCNAVVHGIYLRHRYQVFLARLLIYGGDYYAMTKGQPFYGLVAEDCQEVLVDRVRVSRNGDEAKTKPIVPWTNTRSAAVDGKAEMTRW